MTHYHTLGLPENASAANIRRAYRRLVLLTHPDRTPDPAAHTRYLAINAAYETLSDPARRQAYDRRLQNPMPTAAPPSSPGKARDTRHHSRTTRTQQRAPVNDSARYAAEHNFILRKARPFLIGATLLSISLGIDLSLATETIEQVHSTETFRYQKSYNYTDGGLLILPEELPLRSTLLVKRTPLWHTAISARRPVGGPVFVLPSIYEGANNSFWLGLLLTSSLATIPCLSNDQRLVAALVALVCLALTLLRMLHA